MRKFIAPCALSLSLIVAGCAQDSPTGAELATVVAGGPSFGHESNNFAALSGTQGGVAIEGQAVINYAKGAPEEWRSTVNLTGDLAAGTYTFYVNGPGGKTAVCSFTVGATGGRQGCSADTDLRGFGRATVEDASFNVVASGTFDRRGGTRVG